MARCFLEQGFPCPGSAAHGACVTVSSGNVICAPKDDTFISLFPPFAAWFSLPILWKYVRNETTCFGAQVCKENRQGLTWRNVNPSPYSSSVRWSAGGLNGKFPRCMDLVQVLAMMFFCFFCLKKVLHWILASGAQLDEIALESMQVFISAVLICQSERLMVHPPTHPYIHQSSF